MAAKKWGNNKMQLEQILTKMIRLPLVYLFSLISETKHNIY